MTLIQTPTINGSILTANRQGADAVLSVRIEDEFRTESAIAYLTADQAADLLEALVLLGVQLTKKAELATLMAPERI